MVLPLVEPIVAWALVPNTFWMSYPLIDWPNVLDGGCQESLIWVGEIAAAVNPLGTVVAVGLTDELDDGGLMPFEFIAETW